MIYQSSPAWSLKSKSKEHKEPPTPSPDAYNPNKTYILSKSPTWKLGRQLRRETPNKKAPSPNTYNPQPVEKSQKFGKFSHEQKLKQLISSTPGPGSYDSPKNKENFANSFTHQPKCIVNINGYPGPGAYDPCLAKERVGIKMTKQIRFTTEIAANTTPGPGKYQYQRPNSASHSFGKSEREKSKENINQIGPGQYKFRSTFQGSTFERKGYTMAARHTTKDQRCSPGPANYSPTLKDLPSSPSITMAQKYIEHQSHRTPSPDQYDPKPFDVIKNQSFSIGKAEKLPLKVDNYIPGPGNYLKADYVSTGISISLGKSRKIQMSKDVPGPGAYNPQSSVIQQRPKSTKIGTSKRFEKVNTQTCPSPALYSTSISCFDNPRYSFPKKKRLNTKKQHFPGPGSYNIPSSICNVSCYVLK